MNDNIQETSIKDLFIIERPFFPDDRGSFQEIWRSKDLEARINRPVTPLQGNLSVSYKGVLRGLHAEPMDKIITPLTGKVFLAIADIRTDSPTFGKTETLTLDYTSTTSQPRKSLFLPSGMANSFCVISDEPVLYVYAVTSNYDAAGEKRSVIWNDPDLAIQWPLPEEQLIISEKDKLNPTLRSLFPEKFA